MQATHGGDAQRRTVAWAAHVPLSSISPFAASFEVAARRQAALNVSCQRTKRGLHARTTGAAPKLKPHQDEVPNTANSASALTPTDRSPEERTWGTRVKVPAGCFCYFLSAQFSDARNSPIFPWGSGPARRRIYVTGVHSRRRARHGPRGATLPQWQPLKTLQAAAPRRVSTRR